MKNRKPSFLILYVVILLLLFSWMLGIFGDSSKGLTYSQVVNLFRQEQVRSFTVEGDTIYLQMHGNEETIVGTVADAESFRREMWDTIICTNICITRVPGEKREERIEKILEEIMSITII